MRKFYLLMSLVIAFAFSSTMSATVVTSTADSPVYYVIQNTNWMRNLYCLDVTADGSQLKQKALRGAIDDSEYFYFVASTTTTGAVKIVNKSGKYLSASTVVAGSGNQVLASTATTTATDYIITENTDGSCYIRPAEAATTLGLNFNGGSEYALGLYNTSDAKSKWTLVKVPTTTDELAALATQYLAYNTTIGTLGYPTQAAHDAVAAYQTATTLPTDMQAALTTIYSYYQTINVVMPEAGKAYRIKTGNPTGTSYYLYAKSATEAATIASYTATDLKDVWVCNKTTDGKYIFANGGLNVFEAYEVGSRNNHKLLGPTAAKFILDASERLNMGCLPLNISGRFMCIKLADGTVDHAGSKWTSSTAYTSDFIFEEVAYPNTVTLQAADGGYYATQYNMFASNIPTGVKAYKVTATENKMATTTELTDVIPAQCGVVLVGTGASTLTFAPVESTTTATDNLLQGGVTATTPVAGTNYYTLANESGIGFYKFAGSSIAAGRCYLSSTSTLGVKGFTLNFGTTTGINAVETSTNNVAYDLSGRRVANPTKGLYIINGKKTLVK